MKNETRVKFHALSAQVAKLNGVASASEKFDVQPSVQQTMENRIQESSDYLTMINDPGHSLCVSLELAETDWGGRRYSQIPLDLKAATQSRVARLPRTTRRTARQS